VQPLSDKAEWITYALIRAGHKSVPRDRGTERTFDMGRALPRMGEAASPQEAMRTDPGRSPPLLTAAGACEFPADSSQGGRGRSTFPELVSQLSIAVLSKREHLQAAESTAKCGSETPVLVGQPPQPTKRRFLVSRSCHLVIHFELTQLTNSADQSHSQLPADKSSQPMEEMEPSRPAFPDGSR
jgi:hypothetical protein